MALSRSSSGLPGIICTITPLEKSTGLFPHVLPGLIKKRDVIGLGELKALFITRQQAKRFFLCGGWSESGRGQSKMQKSCFAHFCASKVTQIGVKEEVWEGSVCCVCAGDDFFQHTQITGVARVPEWEGPIGTSLLWSMKVWEGRRPPCVTSTSPMFTTLACYCSLILLMFSAQQTQRVSFSVILI